MWYVVTIIFMLVFGKPNMPSTSQKIPITLVSYLFLTSLPIILILFFKFKFIFTVDMQKNMELICTLLSIVRV